MRMTIEEKLVGISLIAFLLVGGGISFLAATGVRTLAQRVGIVYTDTILPLVDIQQLRGAIHVMDNELLHTLSSDRGEQEEALQVAIQNRQRFKDLIEKYEKEDIINSEPVMLDLLKKVGVLDELNRKEQEAIKLIKTYYPIIQTNTEKMAAFLKSNQKAKASNLYHNEIKPLFTASEKIADVFMELQLDQAKFSTEESNRNAASSGRHIVAVILIGILIVGSLTFTLTRRIISPLRDACSQLVAFSHQFRKGSKEQASAAVEQTEQTIIAIKLSLESQQHGLASQQPMQALYAIDEAAKRFSASTKHVEDASEQLAYLAKDLKRVIGVDSK